MRNLFLSASLAAMAGMAPVLVQAQEAPAQEVTATAEAIEAPSTPREEWDTFSRNDRLVYLINVGGLKTEGGITKVQIARVPLQTAAGDQSYKLDEYEIQCRSNRARMTVEVEFDSEGKEAERYPEDSPEWETIRQTSLPAFFKPIACDGSRSTTQPAPSIQAFIQRGKV